MVLSALLPLALAGDPVLGRVPSAPVEASEPADSQLWERCVSEGSLPSALLKRARDLQHQALTEPESASIGLAALEDYAAHCPTLFMVRAGIAHARGRDAEAEAALAKAESLADWPEIVRAVAVAADRAGDPSRLDDAVAASPEDATIRMRWIRSKPPSEQTSLLRQALRIHPDDAALQRAAIAILAERGNRLEAIAHGRAALKRLDDPQLLALVDELDAPHRGRGPRRPSHAPQVRVLDDGTEEITVFSPAVARETLTRRLHELGWSRESPVTGGTRYRSVNNVQPWITVYDDGRVDVQRSGVVDMPLRKRTRRLGYSGLDVGEVPSGDYGGVTFGRNVVSRRKLRAKRTAVMENIWLEVSAWRMARDLVVVRTQLDEVLPGKLTALWDDGIPLSGSGHIDDPAERRQAILRHWASRACSDAGDAARVVITRFVLFEIDDSEFPSTAQEIDSAVASSPCDTAWSLPR